MITQSEQGNADFLYCVNMALTLLLLILPVRATIVSSLGFGAVWGRSVVLRSRTSYQNAISCFLPSKPHPLPHLPHFPDPPCLWFLLFCCLYRNIATSPLSATAALLISTRKTMFDTGASGVPRGVFEGFISPQNFEALTKLSRIPSSVEYTSVTT
jgi:hypothetical protein